MFCYLFPPLSCTSGSELLFCSIFYNVYLSSDLDSGSLPLSFAFFISVWAICLVCLVLFWLCMLTSLYSNVAISISYTKRREERRRRRDKGEKRRSEENSECLECIFSVLDHCSFLCDENMMMEHSNALDCYMSHHQGCLGALFGFYFVQHIYTTLHISRYDTICRIRATGKWGRKDGWKRRLRARVWLRAGWNVSPGQVSCVVDASGVLSFIFLMTYFSHAFSYIFFMLSCLLLCRLFNMMSDVNFSSFFVELMRIEWLSTIESIDYTTSKVKFNAKCDHHRRCRR